VLGVITAAGLVLPGSALCGSAVRRLPGLTAPSTAAPAVGFSVLLAPAATAIRLPGRAATATVVLVLAIAGSAAYLWMRRSGPRRERSSSVQPVAALATALSR